MGKYLTASIIFVLGIIIAGFIPPKFSFLLAAIGITMVIRDNNEPTTVISVVKWVLTAFIMLILMSITYVFVFGIPE